MSASTPRRRRALILGGAAASLALALAWLVSWPRGADPAGSSAGDATVSAPVEGTRADPELASPREPAPRALDAAAGTAVAPQPPVANGPVATELGTVRGRVVDDRGEPLAGLPVFLVGERGLESRTLESDVGGAFAFVGVPRGSWKVALGGSESPIVPALPAALSGDEIDLGELALPPLGELEVLVVDAAERPVPAIDVTGRGTRGGTVAARTDATGRALARFLPAGEIRVFANDARLGRGNTIVELSSGGRAAATISLRTKP